MIEIDGKAVDLTNPAIWGNSIQLKPMGPVTVLRGGVETRVTYHAPMCKSNIVLTSYPPQYQACDCGVEAP